MNEKEYNSSIDDINASDETLKSEDNFDEANIAYLRKSLREESDKYKKDLYEEIDTQDIKEHRQYSTNSRKINWRK